MFEYDLVRYGDYKGVEGWRNYKLNGGRGEGEVDLGVAGGVRVEVTVKNNGGRTEVFRYKLPGEFNDEVVYKVTEGTLRVVEEELGRIGDRHKEGGVWINR